MKERIKMIMDSENLSPAKFADMLQIGRAVISHILNGRNNPSLDVIIKILTVMPYINSQWLITGNGSMYLGEKEESFLPISENENQNIVHDLFNQNLFALNEINSQNPTETVRYAKEKELTKSSNHSYKTENQTITYREKPEKKIAKIIIYYTDNTFETFKPD